MAHLKIRINQVKMKKHRQIPKCPKAKAKAKVKVAADGDQEDCQVHAGNAEPRTIIKPIAQKVQVKTGRSSLRHGLRGGQGRGQAQLQRNGDHLCRGQKVMEKQKEAKAKEKLEKVKVKVWEMKEMQLTLGMIS